MTIIYSRIDNAPAWSPLSQFGDISDVEVSWRAVGGDWEMTFEIGGATDQAVGLLGQNVRHLPSGWRGRIFELEISKGFSRYTYTMADYANRVAVVREGAITSWSESLPQQAMYGKWELVERDEDLTATQATARAARLLKERKRRVATEPTIDLGSRIEKPTVRIMALGLLPLTARYATNVRTGTGTIGYDALDVVKTTLNANESGGSTALDVVSESGFAANDPVVITLDDGTLHYDEVASTSSGVINITDGLPGAAADTVATSGNRVALGELAVSTWLENAIGDSNMTAGVIADNSTMAQVAEMKNYTNVWQLIEALALYDGERGYTLTADRVTVNYAPETSGATPNYYVTDDGRIGMRGGGTVGKWAVRPGWYRDYSQRQTLYVSEVRVRDDEDYPRLVVERVYGTD